MNVDICERTYKWVMMIKNWFFQINPLQKTQGLPFPSPQKHEQQRYTELSLATISLVSLLSFLAHTSCVFYTDGDDLYIVQYDCPLALNYKPGDVIQNQCKEKKKSRGKRLWFSPFIEVCSIWGKAQRWLDLLGLSSNGPMGGEGATKGACCCWAPVSSLRVLLREP